MHKMSWQMTVYFLRRYERSQSLYMFHSQASTLIGFIMPKIYIFNSHFSILLLITYFYTSYFTVQSGHKIIIPLFNYHVDSFMCLWYTVKLIWGNTVSCIAKYPDLKSFCLTITNNCQMLTQVNARTHHALLSTFPHTKSFPNVLFANKCIFYCSAHDRTVVFQLTKVWIAQCSWNITHLLWWCGPVWQQTIWLVPFW
jgi:hypothetical protein